MIAKLEDLLEGISMDSLKKVLTEIYERDPAQTEFLDAVREVAVSLQPLLCKRPDLIPVFQQLSEPERQIIFRVAWLDDSNEVQVNRGFRVQFSSAIGPYKGGLRFHPSVNLSVIKMLGFEQVFKNALTTWPLGAGKGGSDFDPKGRSDGEIQRFCQSYMTELARYIGDDIDVPAGDIGVGAREIGYLFGYYKRLTGHFDGVLTGKGRQFGGSWCRPEATGYGVVFLAVEALKELGLKLDGLRCAVSGSGNVAIYCAKELAAEGGMVVSVSDSKGTVIEKDGFTKEGLEEVKRIKSTHNGTLAEYKSPTAQYFEKRTSPWQVEEAGQVDVAFPCATQNELDAPDVDALHQRGCRAVIEGANMPTTSTGVERLSRLEMLCVPGKMANAGGVAVSGLEMMQNRAMGPPWESHEILERLQGIMKDIYIQSKACAEKYGCSLGEGANIAAFTKVGEALQAQGAV